MFGTPLVILQRRVRLFRHLDDLCCADVGQTDRIDADAEASHVVGQGLGEGDAGMESPDGALPP